MILRNKTVLFCLPYAGGSSYAFRDFSKYTDDTVEVIPIDYPGHGKRLREPMLTSINDMADFTFQLMEKIINDKIPCAIYGHSMGATVGYQVSRLIEQKGLPMPVHLFFSSRQGPSLPVKEQDRNFHLLPRDQFIEKIMEYGGMPDEVAAEKDLMDLFIPILQTDFKAVDDFIYEPLEPLDVPITAFLGDSEKTTYKDVLKWQEVTSHPLNVKEFEGGHFFIFQHIQSICEMINKKLIASH